MLSPKVRLYVRVTLPDRTRTFLDPVYSGSHKLKPGWALFEGNPKRFDDAVYYARCKKGDKRVYDSLGDDPQHALVELDNVAALTPGMARMRWRSWW
jgi:integrase/recombinase XerD